MGKIYTCCKRWWRFFALARRVWFIGQFFHTNPPDLLITTSITLVAAKAICLKPLQTRNLKFFSHSALHINLLPVSKQKQTRILSNSNGCSISFCSNDSNVPWCENASCNTCILLCPGSKSSTPEYPRPSNPNPTPNLARIIAISRSAPYYYNYYKYYNWIF